MKKLHRRTLLKSVLGATGARMAMTNPLALLLSQIMEGHARAQAQKTTGTFLYIQLAGAPARWTLTPLFPVKADLNLRVPNPMVATKFSGGSVYDDMDYAVHEVEGLQMPWLWQFDVARTGGGVRPMAELLKNMMMIRGIQTIGAHAPAQFLRFHPLGIKQTFGAVVSDASSAPIPAINAEAPQFEHISKKGTSAIDLVTQDDMLDQLLDAFLANPDRFYKHHGKDLRTMVDRSVDAMEAWTLKQSPSSLATSQSLKSARQMIERGFGNLSEEFTDRVQKYQDLVDRTIHQEGRAGINDKPIGAPVSQRDRDYRILDDYIICINPDLRSIVSTEGRFGRANARKMAEHFAVAEYVILNQLSSSITISPDHLGGLTVQMQGRTGYAISHDEHRVGRFGSLLCNTLFNLSLGSCLLELFDRVKEAGRFNELVVDCSGEFGRRPRDKASGSDHDGKSLDVALWSGRLGEKPQVIGDIEAKSEQIGSGQFKLSYSGTWGVGARNPGVGKLNLGHLASTQAHLLNVDTPTRASPSLLKEQAGKLVPMLPTGRIRDE